MRNNLTPSKKFEADTVKEVESLRFFFQGRPEDGLWLMALREDHNDIEKDSNAIKTTIRFCREGHCDECRRVKTLYDRKIKELKDNGNP